MVADLPFGCCVTRSFCPSTCHKFALRWGHRSHTPTTTCRVSWEPGRWHSNDRCLLCRRASSVLALAPGQRRWPALSCGDRPTLTCLVFLLFFGGGGGAAARYEESTIPGAGPVNYRGMAAWTLPGAADTTTSGALKPGRACTKHERLTIVCDLGRDNVQRVAHPRPRPRPRHKRSPRAIAKVRPSETHSFSNMAGCDCCSCYFPCRVVPR